MCCCSSFSGKEYAVTCFSCGVESDNWTADETPWQKHARSSTNCQHVLDVKSVSFVQQTIEDLQEYSSSEQVGVSTFC